MSRFFIFILSLGFATASTAFAQDYIYQQDTLSFGPVPQSEIPQFMSLKLIDPELEGTIVEIQTQTALHVGGAVGVELLETSRGIRHITIDVSSDLKVTLPALNQLALASGHAAKHMELDMSAPFDGIFDFGGASGISGGYRMNGGGMKMFDLNSQNVLEYFQGQGQTLLPVQMIDVSMFQGSGNIINQSAMTAYWGQVTVIKKILPANGGGEGSN